METVQLLHRGIEQYTATIQLKVPIVIIGRRFMIEGSWIRIQILHTRKNISNNCCRDCFVWKDRKWKVTDARKGPFLRMDQKVLQIKFYSSIILKPSSSSSGVFKKFEIDQQRDPSAKNVISMGKKEKRTGQNWFKQVSSLEDPTALSHL